MDGMNEFPDLTLADFGFEKCQLCNGRGFEEHPAYYYGRAECVCNGGIARIDGEDISEEEWDDFLSYPARVSGAYPGKIT